MTRTLSEIEILLGDLKRSIKAREAVVFCGAGISFHSGLPLAGELVTYMFGQLGVRTQDIDVIINSNFPFEAFIEALRGRADIDLIYRIFDVRQPNANHMCLAGLARDKYIQTICTTNLDVLIETALQDYAKLVRGTDFEVYYSDKDLGNIDWDDKRIHVIKIHGSIENRDTIAITLKQVASRLLSENRKKVIEHIFSKGQHRTVLVLGYSCSDSFDISPAITAIGRESKKVVYVEHSNEKKLINVEDRPGKNPFRKYEGSKWLYYDTDDLIRQLWEVFLHTRSFPVPNTSPRTLWKKRVDDWCSKTEQEDKSLKHYIAGEILYRISRYDLATSYYEHALAVSRRIADVRAERRSLGGLGINYSYLGDNQKALDLHEQALMISRRLVWCPVNN